MLNADLFGTFHTVLNCISNRRERLLELDNVY